MLRKPSIRSTLLPLALAFIALIVLNFGLYRRLIVPSSVVAAAASDFAFPYNADFSQATSPNYTIWGGDWQPRDQTLVQLSTSGYDLGAIIPLKIATNQTYQVSAKLHFLGGTMGGGVLFNVQQATSRQQSQMARFNVDGGKLYVIYGYFGDDSTFVGQGSVELGIDPQNADWHTFGVMVGSTNYAITLDNQVIATGIPLKYRGGAVGLVASTSQVAFDDVSVQPIDPSAIPASANPPAVLAASTTSEAPAATTAAVVAPDANTFAPVFTDPFTAAGGADSKWVPFAGKWQFEAGAFVQSDASGYDFSAGSKASYNAPLRLRVTFNHRQGVGGGVLFDMPQPDSKNGAQMVRYIDDKTLAWGQFDATGAFQGIGSAPIPAPGTSAHTLEITASATSYSITLDGSQIAQNVPLNSSGGHIGLTSSQSAVAFTSVEVDSPGVAAATEAAAATQAVANAGVNLNSITGTWTSDGSVFTQTADVQTDSVAGVGIAAEKFRVSVEVTLPPGIADAGGGLVFHMNGRDDVTSGTLVRFAADGQQVFWGTYDAQKAFKGEGSSPLTLAAGQPHKLTLVVRAADYDILVDDQTLVTGVPVTSTRGWIGLIGFRGPIKFTNFELTLSEG